MTDTSRPVVREKVTVAGTALSDHVLDQIDYVRVSLGLGRTGSAEIRVNSYEEDITADIGDELKIELDDDGTLQQVFVGPITGKGVEFARGRYYTVIVAHDNSVTLGRRSTFESVLNASPADLVSTIAGNHGLTASATFPDTSALEHVFQAGTDLELLEWLVDEYGCTWWVDDTTLNVNKHDTSGSGPTLALDDDLRDFRARFGGVDSAASVEFRRWDPSSKAVTVGTYTPVSSDVPSDASLVGSQFDGAVGLWSDTTAVAASDSLPGDVVADTLAKGIGMRMAASMISATGTALVTPTLKPGGTVTVEKAGTGFSGKYLVSDVVHERSAGDPYVTRFACGSGQPPDTPRSGSSWDRLANNVAIGIVTNIEDPDSMNRVKVKIPVISDDHESDWARVVQIGAGMSRGLFILPEVDDEVLVAFENGNLHRPYVLGGLWNGTDAAPTVRQITNGKVMHRSLVTRRGHRLMLHDGDDAATRYFEVSLSDEQTSLTVGEEEIKIISNGKPITIEDKTGTIEMDGSGNIKLSGQEITIEANNALTLKSKSNAVTVQSSTALDVKAGTKLTLKGNSGAELNGSMSTDVKGGMVNIN